MQPIARYTRFVALFKRSLWVLIGITIALVVWIASDNTGENKARIVFSNIMKSDEAPNVMANPHYQGIDARNRPYTVTAESATQIDKENVALTNIHADMVMSSGAWVAMTAGSGKLGLQAKVLELENNVDMFYEGGYEFRTQQAHVDINKGNAYGDAPVEGQGPLGTLKAKSFSIKDHGKVINFNGSVRMKLYR